MDVDYELVYTAPGERFAARLDVVRGHERLLKVTLSLRRRAIDRRALAQLLWHHPFMTHRVTTGIYAQAARLGMRARPFISTQRGGSVGLEFLEPPDVENGPISA